MTYDVRVDQLGHLAMYDLKGMPDALKNLCGHVVPPFPNAPNTKASSHSRVLAHIGPEHWLLWDMLSQETALDARLNPNAAPPDVSIVALSDAYVWFRITGPDAQEIMSIAGPLDVHPSVFSEDDCTFTEMFGLKALVHRCPDGFECAFDRSYVDMVIDYLDRALGRTATLSSG